MHRLAGSDAGFLFIETPDQTSVCVDLAELSPAGPDAPPLTLADLRRQVVERLHLLPSWRWRLEPVPLGVHHPVWIEDPDFDVDHHLRQRTLPAPGGPAEVDAYLAEVEPLLLDLRHPLWEITLVHGLAGDRQALLFRFHHTIADGAALLLTLDLLFGDLPADAPSAGQPPWAPTAPRRSTVLRQALREQAHNWREVPALYRLSKERFSAVEARRAEAEVEVPRSMGGAPGTVLNRKGPRVRRYGRALLPTADLQKVRRATGATLNDVVLGVVAGALRAELAERGELPDQPLVANIPVAGAPTGEPQRQWGNGFSNFFASLATHIPDPVERLAAISANTAEAKVQLDLQGRDTLPRWLDRMPPAIARPASRLMIRRGLNKPEVANFNVLVSNVRVTNPAWHIGGHHVEHIYMSGPIADDAGLNVTVVGFGDELHLSVVASPVAVPDVDGLIDRFHAALEKLVTCTA